MQNSMRLTQAKRAGQRQSGPRKGSDFLSKINLIIKKCTSQNHQRPKRYASTVSTTRSNPVNEEVERVRTRLKEMELKAKAVNSETPAKKSASVNGAINKQTDEDSPSKPAKPAPKKQCPYCLRKFPANLLNDHKKTCTCRIVTCKYCGKGRMARQIATHEKFCDKRPKDSDAKATNKDIAKKSNTAPKRFRCEC